MGINDFVKLTQFSIKRIIDMEKMYVKHFVQDNKESDLDVLDEDTYKDLVKFLKGRLKLTKRFRRKSEHIAEEIGTVFICSGKELAEMLDYYNTLTGEQKQQTIKYFNK